MATCQVQMDSSHGYQSSESGSTFILRKASYESGSESDNSSDPGQSPLDKSSSIEGASKSRFEAHSDPSEGEPDTEDVGNRLTEASLKTHLQAASSCCSLCGDLDLCNWDQSFNDYDYCVLLWSLGSTRFRPDILNRDQMGLMLETTFKSLTQSSINCSRCGFILKGVSAHLNLEPNSQLRFRSSQGGPLFVIHRRQMSSLECSSLHSSYFDDYSHTEDGDHSNGINSHDEQLQRSESESEGESGQRQGSQEYWDDEDSAFSSGFDKFPDEIIEFYVQPGSPSPGTAVGPARTLQAEFTLKDAALVSEWLEDCEQNHENCKKPTPNLPTRVLFIGSDVRLPHLYESRNEEGRYTALSHCWGGEEHRPPSTTKKTLAKHKEAIEWGDLPPTFADAMAVTRLLGIEYIWIDSLCIVQDDADDWVRESAKMASIYQQAVLTISADGACDCYAGLFHTVSQRTAAEPKKIRWTDGCHEMDMCTRLTDLPHKSVRIHSTATVNIEQNPLRRRAWALQEWLVSPRVVHFTRGELIWECTQIHRCECQVIAKKCSSNWRSDTKSQFVGFDEKTNHTMVDWKGMIREFTNRLITKDTDRLPALSGIAALAKPNAADDYVAGIWESGLPSSLMWTRLGETSMRHQDYYAPTWSWASIIGPVVEPYPSLFPIAEVVSLSKELASANPFGPLKSSSITIKCPIARFPSHVKWEGEPLLTFCDASKTYDGKLTLDVTERSEVRNIHEMVMALIGYHYEGRSAFIIGLALKQEEEQESGFRRVGFIEIDITRFPTWRRDVSHALKARNKVITIV